MSRGKKGGEKIFSLWWFLVLVLVAGSVVIGVISFYSASYDVRRIEVDLLGEKILNCISDKGYLKNEVLESNFNLIEKCKLNKDLFDEGSDWYIKIKIGDRKELKEGAGTFEKDCEVSSGLKAKYFPKCINMEYRLLYASKETNEEIDVFLRIGSNQKGDKLIG